MSSIIPGRSALATGTTLAISAVGLLTGPVPAQALPQFPMAPDCSFTGRFVVNQSNGFRVEIPLNDTVFSGSALAFGSDSKAFSGGPVTGSINGNFVDFTVDWDGPSTGKYTGIVDSNGSVSGTTKDVGQPGSTVTWTSPTWLMCAVDLPPKAPPAPKPAPGPAPAPRATTATVVTSDVDVYDQPGGDGNVIGVLRLGAVVKVLAPCPADDWCALADGRYVFGEFLRNN